MPEDTKFCPCGRTLNKEINRRYDGTRLNYCNEECEKRYNRPARTRAARKNHGVAGW